jgi:hypothetical protein
MKVNFFDQPTIYVSHPIRGSNNDFDGNCRKANAAAEKLNRVFPEVNWYVPSEHDLVLQILWRDKIITEDNILTADLEILRNCHGWCFLHWDESSGSMLEWNQAKKVGLTSDKEDWIVADISKASYSYLRRRFTDLVEAAKERYRRS